MFLEQISIQNGSLTRSYLIFLSVILLKKMFGQVDSHENYLGKNVTENYYN